MRQLRPKVSRRPIPIRLTASRCIRLERSARYSGAGRLASVRRVLHVHAGSIDQPLGKRR
jgi:hypothetical protein